MSRYDATMTAIAPAAIVEIRGDAEAARRVLAAAGLAAPARPNTAQESDAAAELWLGPRRWLVLCAGPRAEQLATALEGAAAGEPLAAAVDASDMVVGIALRGCDAAELLGQGTPLDFAALASDGASATDLFMVPAIVRRRGDGFDLWIDRSLGQYLDECLRVANGNEG